ncbi:MAG: hypothetical protein ACO3JG_06135 [Luteolibacter sp.]
MKKTNPTLRWAAIFSLAIGSTSCMTTYDSAGRPVQSVDPGLAVAGAAAAGLIGYALANDNDHHHHHHYRGRHERRYYGHPRDGCRY